MYRFNQIDKNYFSDRCAKIEAMSSRDSDQNLYKVQDCTTFFSYTPSQGSIFVLWSKKTQEGSTPGAATDSGRSSFPRWLLEISASSETANLWWIQITFAVK